MVKVSKGDLVRFEYSGKIASSGYIFDTTDESIAKKAGIHDASAIYGPKLAVFGTRAIIAGVEEAISTVELGQHQEFHIPSDKAFGKRLPELIRMIPEKEFFSQQVRPVPGMVVALDNMLARVKSVTSGRVVVDLNHPLAGEDVVYSVKVHEVISDDQKKIEAILASHALSSAKVSKDAKGFSVAFKKSDDKDKVESAKRIISAVVEKTSFSTS